MLNMFQLSALRVIPFAERHVMEHGLYCTGRQAVYLLNKDWVGMESRRLYVLRLSARRRVTPAALGPFRYLHVQGCKNRHMNFRPTPVKSHAELDQ